LRQVTRDLRGDEGCPWDKEQTHASLSRFAIEEAFELAEAIDSGDNQEIKNELGDVLFQVFLHSEVARQSGTFTLEDVVQNIVEKMVRRHPHVFRETRVKDAAQVVSNWEQIKREERGNEIKDPLETPRGLPALLTALKIGAKTKGLKFDWTKAQDVL